jgi:hypothetical protein
MNERTSMKRTLLWVKDVEGELWVTARSPAIAGDAHSSIAPVW